MLPEQLIIIWNNKFPHDRKWREKYKIAFGSEEHRKANQIDIYFDLLEDKVFDKYREQYIEEYKRLEEYKNTGKWLREPEIDEKKFEELFDKIDVSQFNIQQEENGEWKTN